MPPMALTNTSCRIKLLEDKYDALFVWVKQHAQIENDLISKLAAQEKIIATLTNALSVHQEALKEHAVDVEKAINGLIDKINNLSSAVDKLYETSDNVATMKREQTTAVELLHGRITITQNVSKKYFDSLDARITMTEDNVNAFLNRVNHLSSAIKPSMERK